MLGSAKQEGEIPTRSSLDGCCGSHRVPAQGPPTSICTRNPDDRIEDGLQAEDNSTR